MTRLPKNFRSLLLLGGALAALPAAALAQAAPPGRVGQITGLAGPVSFNGAASNGAWVAATPNAPLVSGDSLYTQAGGQAAIMLGASRLALAPDTELQVTSLDDQSFAATAPQGELFLALTDLLPGQSFTIATPRGAVRMQSAGMVDIVTGTAQTPLVVSVLSGAASLNGAQIPAGQALYLSPDGQSQLGAVQRDDFIDTQMAELAPPPPPYVPAPVAQMSGAAELSAYGSWSDTPDYGAVWFPAVAPDWAPYHNGHWAYVPPWGWTWVEDEPWGFAPFHYGRWAQFGGRWGWVPAAYAPEQAGPPVYAPALVGFFGVGLSAASLASGEIGWVPLAPGEPYRPHFAAGPAYLAAVNRADVRGFTPQDFAHPPGLAQFANRRAAFAVPAAVMAQGQAVHARGHLLPPAQFGQAQPMARDLPLDQAVRPHLRQPPGAAPQGMSQPPLAPPGAHPAALHPAPAMPAPRPQAPGPAFVHPPAPPMHQPQAPVQRAAQPFQQTAPRPAQMPMHQPPAPRPAEVPRPPAPPRPEAAPMPPPSFHPAPEPPRPAPRPEDAHEPGPAHHEAHEPGHPP